MTHSISRHLRKLWFFTIVRRQYARCFEQEEPMLGAAQDRNLPELRAALFNLPAKYREPLVLQVLMGYSTAEIAAELELSQSAVLTRLFLGRKQLRALCGEDTDLDPEV